MANVDINVVLALSLQVYLKAPMILNGVCVIWKGWIDLQRLDGMGYLEYDDERAQVSPVLLFTQMSFPRQETNYDLSLCSQHEDALAQAAFEEARRRTRDFEDRERSHREDLEVRDEGSPTIYVDYLSQISTLS